MAASLSIFGVETWAIRLPSLLLFLLGIWATYKLGALLFNQNIGLVAAFLHATHSLILEHVAGRVATAHYDLFQLTLSELGVLAGLYYARKDKWSYLLLAGVAIYGLRCIN